MSDLAMDDPVELPVELPLPPTRPPEVPEKFWDEAAGAVRLDALLKSYGELERKLGAGRRHEEEPVGTIDPPPEPPATAAEPEVWEISSPHPLIEPDAELNDRLRAAGFSHGQAQLVYELAAERLLPVIRDALGEIEAQRQVDRLQQHFGGCETWGHTARQIKSWAQANLDPGVFATLGASYEGVLALHQMMRASEPELLAGDADPAAELDEAQLTEMVRDPRYWRQRDPEFIARVTAGFKRLYAG